MKLIRSRKSTSEIWGYLTTDDASTEAVMAEVLKLCGVDSVEHVFVEVCTFNNGKLTADNENTRMKK